MTGNSWMKQARATLEKGRSLMRQRTRLEREARRDGRCVDPTALTMHFSAWIDREPAMRTRSSAGRNRCGIGQESGPLMRRTPSCQEPVGETLGYTKDGTYSSNGSGIRRGMRGRHEVTHIREVKRAVPGTAYTARGQQKLGCALLPPPIC